MWGGSEGTHRQNSSILKEKGDLDGFLGECLAAMMFMAALGEHTTKVCVELQRRKQ